MIKRDSVTLFIVLGEFGLNINLFDLGNILYNRYGPVVKINGIMGTADMVILFNPADLYQVSWH